MAWFRRNRGEKSREQHEIFSGGDKELAQELTGLSTSVEASHLSQQVQEKQKEQQEMETTVDNLLERYKSLRRGIRSREGNRATKKQLRHRLNENIENLEDMKKNLKKHQYSNLTVFENRLGQLSYYYEHYEKVCQLIVLGGRTSNIPAIIDSKQDAKKARKYEKRDAKYQQEMNEILHDVALTSMWNDDMESYEEYLKLVVNGELEPSQHPFYAKHLQSFQFIRCVNPSLYEALVPSGKKKKQKTRTAESGVVVSGATALANNPRCSTPEDSRPFYSRMGGKFAELLSNIFPSVETDPRKKRAWTQLGAVATLAGTVFMGYQAIKNAFSDKEKNPNKRGKAGAWAAAGLALMNGDRIIEGGTNFIQDLIGYHPSEKIEITNDLFSTYGFSDTKALSIAESHIGAPVATVSALHFIPIYDLTGQNIVKYENDKFVFDYDNYKKYIGKYKWTDEQKKIVLAAGEKLDNDDSINDGLAAFNIKDKSDLDNVAGTDKEKTLADSDAVQKGRKECCDNVSSAVNTALYNQGLKPKDSASAKEIVKEYNENGGEGMGDSKLNDLMISWIQSGLLDVYGYKDRYKLEDIMNIEGIDLNNKTIEGFVNTNRMPIKFGTFKELFDVVNLTAWIKKNFEGKNAKSDTPFEVSIDTLGDIEFDDHKFYEIWKNETDVLERSTINEMSPTLSNNKDRYVDYLNRWRNSRGKEALDNPTYLVNKELSKEGLKIKDSESEKKVVEEYNNNGGSSNIDKTKMNALMIKWMRDGLLEVDGYKDAYKLIDVINMVNLDNKTMPGFVDEGGEAIKFITFSELFNVAYITDWIKKNFKGRQAISDAPFHIAGEKLGGMEFDDTKTYEIWKNETDILGKKAIKDISPTLRKNKELYAKYLNNRWKVEGENKVDLSGYPLLQDLNAKTGIYFTDVAEAKSTEQLLEALRALRGRYVLKGKRNPFSIGLYGTTPNALLFTNTDGVTNVIEIGDFKRFDGKYRTILKNKEKFEGYLNNRRNGYYW